MLEKKRKRGVIQMHDPKDPNAMKAVKVKNTMKIETTKIKSEKEFDDG